MKLSPGMATIKDHNPLSATREIAGTRETTKYGHQSRRPARRSPPSSPSEVITIQDRT